MIEGDKTPSPLHYPALVYLALGPYSGACCIGLIVWSHAVDRNNIVPSGLTDAVWSENGRLCVFETHQTTVCGRRCYYHCELMNINEESFLNEWR